MTSQCVLQEATNRLPTPSNKGRCDLFDKKILNYLLFSLCKYYNLIYGAGLRLPTKAKATVAATRARQTVLVLVFCCLRKSEHNSSEMFK